MKLFMFILGVINIIIEPVFGITFTIGEQMAIQAATYIFEAAIEYCNKNNSNNQNTTTQNQNTQNGSTDNNTDETTNNNNG